MKADSLEELEDYLRNFVSFYDPDVFDFGALAHIFGACLDCLRERGVLGELEGLGEYLEEDQSEFLFRLVELMRAYNASQRT